MAIEFQEKPYPSSQIEGTLHPIIKKWFFSKFRDFSPPQKFSILNIYSRINTLVSSPTGSGKTLSAFLSIINTLTKLQFSGKLEDKVYCIYISPLKALGNDILRNLKQPLKEISELMKQEYKTPSKIRVMIRTGDTSSYERQKMLKTPPHILITTPESLAIMLTSRKFRNLFTSVKWAIIDEIHSLADSKRGTHLSLSLERLQEIAEEEITRIGLSATVSPLEEVAKFLVGLKEKELFRPCKIINISSLKKLDIKVLSPCKDIMGSSYREINNSLYSLLHNLIQSHRTTLIFTNTRAATERVVHNLKTRYPSDYVENFDAKTENEETMTKKGIGAHHSSLSRTHRFRIEKQLKEGKLKCVVSSTSLELGIDIGYIDLVILLGSPKSVARALQRIGRSGHKLHETAKGRIVVLDRDDLVECSVLLKNAIEGRIDKIQIPKNPLDVLAQHIYGIAIDNIRKIDDVFNLIRKSYPYSTLSYEEFFSVIRYLSGEYVSLRDRHVYAKIWYDEEKQEIGKKGKLARLIYMTNIGTIPDEANIQVKIIGEGDPYYIGSISEVFLERLKKGDVFVLGGDTYEFRYARGNVASVKAVVGKPPTVPSWFSEMLPLSFELGKEIGRFRKNMEELFKLKKTREEIIKYIHDYLYVDEFAANSLYKYFLEQYKFLEIPHKDKILVEDYKDGNKHYLIFHSVNGRRVNDVLSRAIGFSVSKLINHDVEININDNGFYIASKNPVNISAVLRQITPENLYKLMSLVLEKTEVLKRRFRHCAARALMILRNYKGNIKTTGRQQVSSSILINAVKRIEKETGQEFPILKEAKREVLEDLMDIKNALSILKGIKKNKIKLKEEIVKLPSPFSHNLVLQGYLDIIKLEDRHEFLKKMHQLVLSRIDPNYNAGPNTINELKYASLKKKKEVLPLKERLLKDLDKAYRTSKYKLGMTFEMKKEAEELIEGRKGSISAEFREWLSSLFSGTVPTYWSDEIVKFFKAKLHTK